MKKTFVILFIIATGLLICSSILTIHLSLKIKNIEKNQQTQLDSLKIKDSTLLQKAFSYDKLDLKVIPEQTYIRLGDSIKIHVWGIHNNSADTISFVPYAIVGTDMDTINLRIQNIFDTIYMNNWTGLVKYKSDKIGKQIIYGQVYLTKKLCWFFNSEFQVLDNSKYNSIKQIFK